MPTVLLWSDENENSEPTHHKGVRAYIQADPVSTAKALAEAYPNEVEEVRGSTVVFGRYSNGEPQEPSDAVLSWLRRHYCGWSKHPGKDGRVELSLDGLTVTIY